MKNLITFGTSNSHTKDLFDGNKLNQSLFGKFMGNDKSLNAKNTS